MKVRIEATRTVVFDMDFDGRTYKTKQDIERWLDTYFALRFIGWDQIVSDDVNYTVLK